MLYLVTPDFVGELRADRAAYATAVTLLVSVIIPAFDAERYLAETLESVMQQSHPADEIIVVDDGSADGTEQVVARFDGAVTYCGQPRSGAAAARNHGTRLATGSFLTFLDADDTWERTKLERQMAAFEQDPGCRHRVRASGAVPEPRRVGSISGTNADRADPMDGYHPGTMMLRRSTFEAVGPFREDHEVGDFVDWYARAVEQRLTIQMLPDVVMHRRLHEKNMGRQNHDRRDGYARVLRTVIDRRRLAGS